MVGNRPLTANFRPHVVQPQTRPSQPPRTEEGKGDRAGMHVHDEGREANKTQGPGAHQPYCILVRIHANPERSKHRYQNEGEHRGGGHRHRHHRPRVMSEQRWQNKGEHNKVQGPGHQHEPHHPPWPPQRASRGLPWPKREQRSCCEQGGSAVGQHGRVMHHRSRPFDEAPHAEEGRRWTRDSPPSAEPRQRQQDRKQARNQVARSQGLGGRSRCRGEGFDGAVQPKDAQHHQRKGRLGASTKRSRAVFKRKEHGRHRQCEHHSTLRDEHGNKPLENGAHAVDMCGKMRPRPRRKGSHHPGGKDPEGTNDGKPSTNNVNLRRGKHSRPRPPRKAAHEEQEGRCRCAVHAVRPTCKDLKQASKGSLEERGAHGQTVAMVWREATSREELAAQPIAALAKSLGADIETWLDVVERPLPETLRLTPNRSDIEWTRRTIEGLGGVRMPWITAHEAYTMPFPRGHAEGEARQVLSLLHTTGRVTRQEAASMLPVEVLPLEGAELVLDLCAAPGSKTTQVAERAIDATVVANEPVSGRVNTLVSNRGRVSLDNVVIVQHDGRHFPRIPPPGFDAIIADLPCTGSATMRKNRDVWWDWRPSAGRGMHALQVGIAVRAANLLRPGGHMVVSTCSLDPVENEAVIADVLHRCPWMDVLPLPSTAFPGLVLREGLTEWTVLADDGSQLHEDAEGMDAFRPPGASLHAALRKTRRLHPEDNDTGGFYLALLRHRPEATPEGIARTLVGSDVEGRGYLRNPAPRSRHDVDPADGSDVDDLIQTHALPKGLAWWRRGKRLAISPSSAKHRLWTPDTPDGKGGRHRGEAFHPLRVIHIGLPVFANNKGQWRIRQEGLAAIERRGRASAIEIPLDLALRLLHGEALEVGEAPPQLSPGACLVACSTNDGHVLLPVWVQAKVTLMLDEEERRVLILRLTGHLPTEDEA